MTTTNKKQNEKNQGDTLKARRYSDGDATREELDAASVRARAAARAAAAMMREAARARAALADTYKKIEKLLQKRVDK